MTSLSIRTEKKILDELDRLASLRQVDRTTIVKRILERGIDEEKLELAIYLYTKGESIGRTLDVSQCNIWELLDELKKRGITKHFDLEDAKEIILSTIGKNDSTLQDKLNELK